MPDQHYFIGIDFGGSKIEVILCHNEALNVIFRKRVKCEKERGYAHLITQLKDLIETCRSHVEHIDCIGLAIPGSVNPNTHLVRNCNVTCFNGKPLAEDVSVAVAQTVHVFNDANCFAISEALLGAGKGYRTCLGMIVGTGIGAGLVEDGVIKNGHNGYAAEVGHMSIDPNGPLCWCGNHGCIETFISGTALERIYRDHGGAALKVPDIHQQLQQQHPIAEKAFAQYFTHFGHSVANLIYSFDADVIILGGGVSRLQLLYSRGKEAISNHFKQEKIAINLVPSEHGDASGVYGAVLAAVAASPSCQSTAIATNLHSHSVSLAHA